MKKQPKVSVVVPIYGVEKYLHQCVDSILAQTLKDIEIILVDDGSKDRCPEIVDEYAKKDPRIVAVHQPNGGYGKAVNHGIELARGEYIGIVEPDDWIDITMYQKLYEKITETESDVVKSLFFYFYGNLREDNLLAEKYDFFIPEYPFKIEDCPDFLYRHPSIWDCLYRKSFLEKNNIRIMEAPGAGWTDNLFQVQTLCLADKISFIDESLYYWRCFSIDLNEKLKDWTLPLRRIDEQFDWVEAQGITDDGVMACLYRRLFSYIRIATERCPLSDIINCSSFVNKLIENLNEEIVQHYKVSRANRKLYKRLCKRLFFCVCGLKYRKIRRKCRDFICMTVNKVKIRYLVDNKKNEVLTRFYSATSNALKYDCFQDYQISKRIRLKFSLQKLLAKIKHRPCYVHVDGNHNFLNILLNKPSWSEIIKYPLEDSVLLCWEIRPIQRYLRVLETAIKKDKTVLFVGDSFLRSINTFADKEALPCYQKGISFTFDDLTSYFDATRPSRMEMMLNDKNLILNKEQVKRSKQCIDYIVKNHLTKYNSQPIFTPDIGRKGVKKVLVVDQSYNDMSIIKGLGSEAIFDQMLKSAIAENPDADIIVKTHPDTIAGCRGYYTSLTQHGNIYTQTEPINPISLIQYCDKVYVCTTQFGFEALMCDKEVHVFGMPFYAGWGLTHDRQKCERRTNKRSLEELFYIAYIMYSYYVNPEIGKQCEIEEAMDYLLKLRTEYFDKYNIRFEN